FVDCPGGKALSGTVTAQGKTVVFGTVTAITADQRTFTVPINADGTYVLKDLPPGPVRLAVSSPNPRPVTEQHGVEPPAETSGGAGRFAFGAAMDTPSGGAAAPAPPRVAPAAGVMPGDRDCRSAAGPPLPTAARAAQAGWFRIPGRYASPTTSGLGTEVRRGRTTVNLRLD
ncbi:MAG: carboxypeptidase-like regulatory domain-containing protein, partial [Planctomycetia bacterium]